MDPNDLVVFKVERKYKGKENERKAELMRGYRERDPERDARSRRSVRVSVLNHYSKGKMCCACCGEQTFHFLSIDHIAGGGIKHFKEINYHLESWLRKNNFPPGYQILCHNCNRGRYLNGGICPHKEEDPYFGEVA